MEVELPDVTLLELLVLFEELFPPVLLEVETILVIFVVLLWFIFVSQLLSTFIELLDPVPFPLISIVVFPPQDEGVGVGDIVGVGVTVGDGVTVGEGLGVMDGIIVGVVKTAAVEKVLLSAFVWVVNSAKVFETKINKQILKIDNNKNFSFMIL